MALLRVCNLGFDFFFRSEVGVAPLLFWSLLLLLRFWLKLIRRRLLELLALPKALSGDGRFDPPEEVEFGVLIVLDFL